MFNEESRRAFEGHVLQAWIHSLRGEDQACLTACGRVVEKRLQRVPVIHALRAEGAQVEGPLPADTLFTPRHLQAFDAVLTMYHDQGLPVLKYAGFGTAVNLTLGLPILRTSVDHGTALDLAGTGTADGGSFSAAIAMAAELCHRRRA